MIRLFTTFFNVPPMVYKHCFQAAIFENIRLSGVPPLPYGKIKAGISHYEKLFHFTTLYND